MRQPTPQNSVSKNVRLAPDAGLAIGAILFVVALLAVLAIAMSSGSSTVGSTVVADRIRSELKSQGNLIRAKILECNQYSLDRGELADKYPSSTGSGTLVSALHCLAFDSSGAQTVNTPLWTGAHPAALPPPPSGMDEWYYVNAGAANGRCIRMQPLAPNVNDTGIRTGLSQAFSAFAVSGTSSQEGTYDPVSTSQRFILWITTPSGTADTNCQS